MRSWLRLLAAELPGLRDLPLGERPLPRVEVALGPSVPGWALRAASVLVTAGLLVIATQRAAVLEPVAWTIVVVVAAVMVLWPSAPLALAATVLAGLLVAADAYGPFDPLALVLTPVAYTAYRLGWWAERVSLAGRVELTALGRGLGLGVAVTGAAVAFGGLVFVLAGRPVTAAVVVGGVALLALAGLLVTRQKTSG